MGLRFVCCKAKSVIESDHYKIIKIFGKKSIVFFISGSGARKAEDYFNFGTSTDNKLTG